MWFLSLKLSRVSIRSIVSRLEIAFVGALKLPSMSKSPGNIMYIPDKQLVPERMVVHSLLMDCVLFQDAVKMMVM